MQKTRVILDTNFAMIPGQFRVDIYTEFARILNFPYELCIFKATLVELQKLAKSNGKDGAAAKLALVLIKQQNLKILPNSFKNNGVEEHYTDAIIVAESTPRDIVCTQDKALKRALKDNNVAIITLQSQKRLGLS